MGNTQCYEGDSLCCTSERHAQNQRKESRRAPNEANTVSSVFDSSLLRGRAQANAAAMQQQQQQESHEVQVPTGPLPDHNGHSVAGGCGTHNTAVDSRANDRGASTVGGVDGADGLDGFDAQSVGNDAMSVEGAVAFPPGVGGAASVVSDAAHSMVWPQGGSVTHSISDSMVSTASISDLKAQLHKERQERQRLHHAHMERERKMKVYEEEISKSRVKRVALDTQVRKLKSQIEQLSDQEAELRRLRERDASIGTRKDLERSLAREREQFHERERRLAFEINRLKDAHDEAAAARERAAQAEGRSEDLMQELDRVRKTAAQHVAAEQRKSRVKTITRNVGGSSDGVIYASNLV